MSSARVIPVGSATSFAAARNGRDNSGIEVELPYGVILPLDGNRLLNSTMAGNDSLGLDPGAGMAQANTEVSAVMSLPAEPHPAADELESAAVEPYFGGGVSEVFSGRPSRPRCPAGPAWPFWSSAWTSPGCGSQRDRR